MSAATLEQRTDPAASAKPQPKPRVGTALPAPTPVPLTRLVHVELRKMVNTLAGRWLLIVTLGIALVTMALVVAFGEDTISVGMLLAIVALPFGILLPVVGVMAATAEWSQRAGLVTFTLEPRRWRVIMARIIAGAVLGVVVVLASMALSYAVAAGASVAGVEASFTLEWGMALGFVLMMALLVLQGIGFGFMFLNTPISIVAILALPTAFSIATSLSSRMETIGPWVDLARASGPLMNGSMTGEQVAQLGTASLLWIVLPLAIGAARVIRREVK